MDDYQEPPEPTIEEERDYYKRERNRLQSELATAQRTIEALNASLPLSSGKTRNEARALLGPILRHDDGGGSSHGCVEVQNAHHVVDTLIGERNLATQQLQSAMEERDAARRQLQVVDHALFDGRELNYTPDRLLAIQTRDKLAKETVEKLAAANSRLEEAHKDLGADYRKHLDAAMQLGETCSCTDINYLIDVLDAVLLSRLSASRETGRKDSGL